MKKTSKKLLALLLALVMLLGLLPMAALAEDGDDPEASIRIVPVSPPASAMGHVGTTVSVNFTLYNDTPNSISFHQHALVDGSGTPDMTAVWSASAYANGTNVPAGVSMNGTYTFTVRQADVDAGALIRSLTQQAQDLSNGSTYSATTTINIPLYAPHISAEVSSCPTSSDAGVGDTIDVVYRMINATANYVSFNGYVCTDGTGALTTIKNSVDQPGYDSSAVGPGEDVLVTITYEVNQNDRDMGKLVRNLVQKASQCLGDGSYTADPVTVEVTLANAPTDDDEPFTPVTISIPIQKIVSKGCKDEPEARTFQFELFGFGTGSLTAADLKISGNTIATNGVGTYNGTLKIQVDTEDLFGDLTEGFYIRETKGTASYWAYSRNVYFVSYDGENWVISKTVATTSEDGPGYEVGEEVASAGFTNKYTKIPEDAVNTPKMGDSRKTGLWLALALAAMVGMAACVILPRVKKFGRNAK